MAEIIKLKDFLKPSYEAIEREKKERENEQNRDSLLQFFDLLQLDGRDIAKSLFDFLATAFVDISEGATCLEWEKQTENLNVFLIIKRKGTE